MNQGGLPPTPRRISRSRQRGDSGVSVHLARSVAFCGFVVALPWTWQRLQDGLVEQIRRSIALVASDDPTREALGALRGHGNWATWATWSTWAWIVPGLLWVLVLSTGTFLVQTGGTWAFRRPRLRWPGSGWDDRSPSPSPPRGGLAACRTLCFGLALAMAAHAQGADGLLREASRHHEAPSALLFVQTNTIALLRMGALAALVAGTLDFLVVRWAWRRRLAMSPAEVRQEQREVEGLPERKSVPRQRHKELTETSLQNGASPLQVLVTAAAWGAFLLRRDESPEGGPRWLLETRTQGRLARKLLELGRDSGVSIVVDETVARRLSHLTPGDPLPADLADVLEAQG